MPCWRAVLASGQGWKAAIAADSKGVPFFTTWSVRIQNGSSFRIRLEGTIGRRTLPGASSPPCSIRAIEILQGFCRLHDVGSGFLVAVAKALMVPVHNYYGLPVRLQQELLQKNFTVKTLGPLSIPGKWRISGTTCHITSPWATIPEASCPTSAGCSGNPISLAT